MRTPAMLVLSALMLLSCDQGIVPNSFGPQLNTSSISFSFASSSIPSDVKLVVVRLERQGFPTFSDSVAVLATVDSVRMTFVNVPAGSWTATVEARNAQGATRYRGSANVVVTEGQVTRVFIQMTAISGGEVRITLVWGTPIIQWKMNASNPVFKQTTGYWDQDHYYFVDPVVLKINGTYQMWYQSGLNRTTSAGGIDAFWIAYATSADGITWTKQGPVLGPGAPGGWMDIGPYSPCVIYEDGLYKMWFSGAKAPLSYRNGIGYATSSDGRIWTVDPLPVIPATTFGSTCSPSVIKMGSLYNLFMGVTTSTTEYPLDIVMMTSADGRSWTSKGVVLSARRDLAWQQSGILPCEVIYDEGRLKMFYTGFSVQDFCIGYAESSDGTSWDNSFALPVLTTSDTSPWITKEVGFPAVMRDNGVLKIWFSGVSSQASKYQIGYAEQVK